MPFFPCQKTPKSAMPFFPPPSSHLFQPPLLRLTPNISKNTTTTMYLHIIVPNQITHLHISSVSSQQHYHHFLPFHFNPNRLTTTGLPHRPPPITASVVVAGIYAEALFGVGGKATKVKGGGRWVKEMRGRGRKERHDRFWCILTCKERHDMWQIITSTKACVFGA